MHSPLKVGATQKVDMRTPHQSCKSPHHNFIMLFITCISKYCVPRMLSCPSRRDARTNAPLRKEPSATGVAQTWLLRGTLTPHWCVDPSTVVTIFGSHGQSNVLLIYKNSFWCPPLESAPSERLHNPRADRGFDMVRP